MIGIRYIYITRSICTASYLRLTTDAAHVPGILADGRKEIGAAI